VCDTRRCLQSPAGAEMPTKEQEKNRIAGKARSMRLSQDPRSATTRGLSIVTPDHGIRDRHRGHEAGKGRCTAKQLPYADDRRGQAAYPGAQGNQSACFRSARSSAAKMWPICGNADRNSFLDGTLARYKPAAAEVKKVTWDINGAPPASSSLPTADVPHGLTGTCGWAAPFNSV